MGAVLRDTTRGRLPAVTTREASEADRRTEQQVELEHRAALGGRYLNRPAARRFETGRVWRAG